MRFKGVGLAMLAAICWGMSGGITGILMNRGWDAIVISLYRGLLDLYFFSRGFSFASSKIGSSPLGYPFGPY